MSDLGPVYDDFGVPMNEPLDLRPMTLRDALAAALRDTGPDSPYLDGGEHDRQWADAILSDPAFRAALTEAVAEAFTYLMYGLTPEDEPVTVLEQDRITAGEFVARMLGDKA